MALLAWVGLSSASARPLPSIKTCTAWTQGAIIYVQGGEMNCTDGPLYVATNLPATITLDDITISATPDSGIKFSNLTGAGRVQLCVDDQGKLYRGNPGC